MIRALERAGFEIYDVMREGTGGSDGWAEERSARRLSTSSSSSSGGSLLDNSSKSWRRALWLGRTKRGW
jgi:hypothetical protein